MRTESAKHSPHSTINGIPQQFLPNTHAGFPTQAPTSLRELFKHVRVGIHEVNSDIDCTLRRLRRLNDLPSPVVLKGHDELPILFTSAATLDKLFFASAHPMARVNILAPSTLAINVARICPQIK